MTIGNSFSEDATRYLHEIAKAEGVDVEIVNVAIGGCSLAMHHRNMIEDNKNYLLIFNGVFTGFCVTLKEALHSREWDVITIQQVSHDSPKKETFYPYITELVSYIRASQPKAKLLFQETWAYEDGSQRLTDELGYGSHKAMLSDVQASYRAVAEAEGLDGVIPSGTLFGKMLDAGIEKVHRDTFHASLGLGRYALGLLWFRMLTGKSVAENGFCELDEPAAESDVAIAKACVDSFSPLF